MTEPGMHQQVFPRILTDIEEPRVSAAWWDRTDFRPEVVGGKGFFSDLAAAIRLFRASRTYDIVVVGCSRKGVLFAALSALCPHKRVPILMVDCLWDRPRDPFLLWAKRIRFRLVSRAVSKFVVWASREVRDYAATFLVPEEKFLHIPHHHTLEGYEYQVSSGNYIFSGGDGNRDYQTLISAVRGLGIKVVIATRRTDWHGGMSVPSEVVAFPASHSDFRKWMAGSRIVVVPMEKGHLHTGGEQTYLNAMAMGKPVIVGDNLGATDYIQHGVNGLIVPSGNAVALRAAINSLIDNPALAARLADNAKRAYDVYSTPKCMERILEAAQQIAIGAKRGADMSSASGHTHLVGVSQAGTVYKEA